MKIFKIPEQQMAQIGAELGECPAKYVFGIIEFLRSLKPDEEKEDTSNKDLKVLKNSPLMASVADSANATQSTES